jgi:hypothetical protein
LRRQRLRRNRFVAEIECLLGNGLKGSRKRWRRRSLAKAERFAHDPSAKPDRRYQDPQHRRTQPSVTFKPAPVAWRSRRGTISPEQYQTLDKARLSSPECVRQSAIEGPRCRCARITTQEKCIASKLHVGIEHPRRS